MNPLPVFRLITIHVARMCKTEEEPKVRKDRLCQVIKQLHNKSNIIRNIT